MPDEIQLVEELVVDAKPENVEQVSFFILGYLADKGIEKKAKGQLYVAIDELFSNISLYAYKEEGGKITTRIGMIGEDKTVIDFIDSGIPFNPLEHDDPDVTLGAEERSIGGLGIFIVKNTMDDVIYEYKNGQNCLRIIKTIK